MGRSRRRRFNQPFTFAGRSSIMRRRATFGRSYARLETDGGMFKEFKEFAFKGNVFDLAIAVIIGAAFGKIVTALVDNIFTPLIGLILGGVDFSKLAIKVGDAQILYGAFIQAVIDFIIVAFVLFLIVKGINRTRRKQEAEVP